LQQVIINLSNNAMDAMMNNGVLTLKTEQYRDGALSWVCLKVIDTGPESRRRSGRGSSILFHDEARR